MFGDEDCTYHVAFFTALACTKADPPCSHPTPSPPPPPAPGSRASKKGGSGKTIGIVVGVLILVALLGVGAFILRKKFGGRIGAYQVMSVSSTNDADFDDDSDMEDA